jgi:hypothetical protein
MGPIDSLEQQAPAPHQPRTRSLRVLQQPALAGPQGRASSYTIKSMETLTKPLRETDFVEWAAQTAELLRQGRFAEVDLEQVAEEIQDLADMRKAAVRSQMRRLLMHLIKLRSQSQRGGSSWRRSIAGARAEIEDALEESPSLRRHLEETLERTYRRAVKQALDETNLTSKAAELAIPETCPYTLDELLGGDLNALWQR